MPEDHRRSGKHLARGHPGRHHATRGSTTRLARNKSHILLDPATAATPASPRRTPLYRSNSAPKKSVIQLEREDSDTDEYEDTDEDSARGEDDSTMSTVGNETLEDHLNVGIHPVEPTPPQLSEERVVSVTSVADMASALKNIKRGFVEDADLVSNAVSRSQSTADLSRIVGVSNRTQRRQLLKQRQPYDTPAHQGPTPPGGETTYREFEKIFRVYVNTRTIKNPVLSSFWRVSTQRPAPAPSRPMAVRRVSSLSATTVNQMSDLSLNKPGSLEGGASYVSNYVLKKMWEQGWQDPEEPSGGDTNEVAPASSIQGKAQRVHQKIKLPRRSSAIKLA